MVSHLKSQSFNHPIATQTAHAAEMADLLRMIRLVLEFSITSRDSIVCGSEEDSRYTTVGDPRIAVLIWWIGS